MHNRMIPNMITHYLTSVTKNVTLICKLILYLGSIRAYIYMTFHRNDSTIFFVGWVFVNKGFAIFVV